MNIIYNDLVFSIITHRISALPCKLKQPEVHSLSFSYSLSQLYSYPLEN